MKKKFINETILSYVDSEYIKDHLKKINYNFSLEEAACLVIRSKEHTLNEKIGVLEELLKNMPDCSVTVNGVEFTSLHKCLRNLIKIYEKTKRYFYDSSGDVAYCIEVLHIDENKVPRWVDSGELFADLESAMEFYKEVGFSGPRIRILKKCICSISEPADGCVYAIMNRKLEIMDFGGDFNFLDNSESEILWFSEHLCISIPTSFKRGDILIDKYNLVDHSLNKPFILDSVYAWNEDKYREFESMSYRGLYVDTYLDLNPILNDFNGNNYLNLEKYEGELHGYDKLLGVYKKYGLSTDPESGGYKLPPECIYDFQNALMDQLKQIN